MPAKGADGSLECHCSLSSHLSHPHRGIYLAPHWSLCSHRWPIHITEAVTSRKRWKRAKQLLCINESNRSPKFFSKHYLCNRKTLTVVYFQIGLIQTPEIFQCSRTEAVWVCLVVDWELPQLGSVLSYLLWVYPTEGNHLIPSDSNAIHRKWGSQSQRHTGCGKAWMR